MKRRSYLFIYGDPLGSREAITEFLNSRPEILYWRYDMPNTFYLISEKIAARLVQGSATIQPTERKVPDM